jgi:lysophospholipase L1-like esterase
MIKPIYIAATAAAIYAAFYLRKANASKKSVAIVGDSLSLASGGWQDILSKKYGWDVDNFSVTGQTSATAYNRFKALGRDNYDIVFIFLGANDAYSGINAGFTLDNIKKIQQLAKEKGAKTIIIPGYLSSKVTNSPKGKIYDDLKSQFIGLPGMVVPILRSVDVSDSPDGVHFGLRANKQLAQLIDAWSLR